MTLIGGLFRFTSFGKLGLAHFDEGIYALGGLWPFAPEGLASLKAVIYYAPPGYPILVGLVYFALGICDWAAILVSLGCGVATIPVVAWLGRRMFGAEAGVAGASLAALSMPHIAFSRKALTDVPFLLAWLVAIGLGGRFLEKPGFARAVALGLVVGIAQNIKYNGWIAGGLVFLAAVLGLTIHRREWDRESMARTLGWGALAAVISLIVYLPWFLAVEREAGYSSLMEHHRAYLGGLATWWPHWNQQLAQANALSGGASWIIGSWALAIVSCILVRGGQPVIPGGSLSTVLRSLPLLLLGAFAYALVPNLPWWVGLGWAPWLLRSDHGPVRLVGCWWLVLSILTPFYYPYARLWLPTQAAGWLIMGRAIADSTRFLTDPAFPSGTRLLGLLKKCTGAVAVMALTSLALVIHTGAGPAATPLPRDWVLDPDSSLRRIVFVDLPRACPLAGKRVRVLGRRPLAFYLLLRGASFQLEENLESAIVDVRPKDCLLLDGALIGHQLSGEAIARRLGPAWNLEAKFVDRLDAITLLDYNPAAATLDPKLRTNRNSILLFTPGRKSQAPDRAPVTPFESGSSTHEP